MIHNLKILPEYFEEVCRGQKTFEIRKNDRNFKVDDLINLREWRPQGYTGQEKLVRVTCITDFEQNPGFVVMAIVQCYAVEIEMLQVKKDAILAAVSSIELGLEYARERLITHEVELGRTIPRNERAALIMENDIQLMATALEMLREYQPSPTK